MAASLQTTGQDSLLVFEVKNPIPNPEENKNLLTYNEIVASDPLVENLRSYLQQLNSPLAEYTEEIVKQPQWQRALAISWVESNMCRRQVDNNCSGIGVAPGHKLWRKYPTKLDWFKDMTNLLEMPLYKEKYTTFKQMKGVYVQPGSYRWVYGAQAKYDELMALTKRSEEERILAAKQLHIKTVVTTFPELAYIK